MKSAFSELDFSSVEWGWSFWLIIFLPAIAAFSAGLHFGTTKRSARAQSILFWVPLTCLSIVFWCLWAFHAERIDQARISYFMEHENSPISSWPAPPPDEPVYDDWSTPGSKGLYVTVRKEDGSLYCRPPNWVLPLAPFYCITFWTIGYFLCRRVNLGV